MAVLEFLFFLLFHFPILKATYNCPISVCSSDNIPIRFPFLLAGQQPQHCGYPGFNLSCNNQSLTVLKLPYSGEFLVRDINYLTQQIQLYDSDNCLARKLLHLNLSDSPFVADIYQNYTFLSCPTQLITARLITPIDCLSNSTTSVLATSSISLVNSMPASCEKIISLPVPISWPAKSEEGFFSELNSDLQLSWYAPDCEQCEAQAGTCGFKTNASQDIGCYYSSKTGRSNNGIQIFKIICLSIAIPALSLAAGIAYYAYCIDRRYRRPRSNTAHLNSTPASVTPEPTIVTVGLDESTIESYQKLVLGESRRLPGLNDSSCPICLSEYSSKETVRCIPECHHCFHTDCIDEWLRMNSTCPVCRNSPSPAHAGSQNV